LSRLRRATPLFVPQLQSSRLSPHPQLHAGLRSQATGTRVVRRPPTTRAGDVAHIPTEGAARAQELRAFASSGFCILPSEKTNSQALHPHPRPPALPRSPVFPRPQARVISSSSISQPSTHHLTYLSLCHRSSPTPFRLISHPTYSCISDKTPSTPDSPPRFFSSFPPYHQLPLTTPFPLPHHHSSQGRLPHYSLLSPIHITHQSAPFRPQLCSLPCACVTPPSVN
jgi:hypothetical protein